MSRVTEQHYNTDPVEQLSLLSQEELTKLRCPSASRTQKGEAAPHKVPSRNIEEHVVLSDGYAQASLPGL